MSELQQFHEELMADVVAEAAAAGGSHFPDAAFKENAFTRIVMSDLESAGILEAPVACYFAHSTSRQPFKVNGYGIPSEDSRLDLVVTEFRPGEEVQKLTASDVDGAFKRLLRFLALAVEQGPRGVESSHEEYSMLREIFDHRDGFDRAQLILITNAVVAQRKERERREQVGRYKVGYEIWDLERARRFRSSGAAHEPVSVDFSDLPGGGLRCVPVSDEGLGYQACVAIIPGRVLYDLYEEHSGRLLELNVRSYLQARGKINKGILETLLVRPHEFLAFNNGITIVAEKIHFDRSATLMTAVEGLQIVNGGQTTASIHRAHKENRADLTHVFVQAKVTVVPADQFDSMVPEISKLSNTQNKVSTVDLGANHAFHIGVERVSRRTWAPGEQSMWFYERARGAFQTERTRVGSTPAKRAAFDAKFPAGQRIVKEDLARYCNTWDGFPHVVSRGGQKNFERFMNSLAKVEKGWEPPQEEFRALVAKAILFQEAQRLAKAIGIKAFGINIVTYTVALLADKSVRRIDLNAIWSRQGLTPALRAQLSAWLPKVAERLLASAGEKNPGEWFKTEQCWLSLRGAASEWSISKELAAELVSVGDGAEHVTADVQNNIARCLAVSAETWLKIQIWGVESKELLHWQAGIANTLSGYAAAGWKKKPSEKQARHAVAMLERFETAQRERS